MCHFVRNQKDLRAVGSDVQASSIKDALVFFFQTMNTRIFVL